MRNYLITLLSYLNTPWKRKLISWSKRLKGQYGIEIGGPSPIVFSLKSIFPAYVFAKTIDGVNFSNNTIWEGTLKEGNTYNYFQKKFGHQYITEATDLNSIKAGKYDFALSSHSLEHIANPIKALLEWKRVLKDSGILVLVLPDKTHTFDGKRAYTTFTHLLDDLKYNTDESDPTHIKEILEFHDFSKDPTSNYKEFEERLKNNYTLRTAHHHVFNFTLITEILTYAGFKTIYQQACSPFHLVTIAQKAG